jgi:SAM-dependent methyltransferase
MPRLPLAEICDFSWCPATLRDGVTDFLTLILDRVDVYAPMVRRLERALRRTEATRIVDLCAGSGGPWRRLLPRLARGRQLSVLFTDKYPNHPAMAQLAALFPGQVVPEPAPIDATAPPEDLPGFRTLFSAFHHFSPDQARLVLADAVRRRQGIAVCEFTSRSAAILWFLPFLPLLVLFLVPAIRPFRWSRLVWTYLPPVLPLVVFYDALASCLRAYSPKELRAFVAGVPGHETFDWEIGTVCKGPGAMPVTYLLGCPHSP